MNITRTFKSAITALVLVVAFALPLVVTGAVSAQVDNASKEEACRALGKPESECLGTTNEAGSSITSLIADVVNILSIVVGVAAVFMIILGGFRYVTSHGDSNAISGAKNTILYAIIGLVIAALAQALVRFVLRKVTT